ncbi:hypothetical protein Tco_1293929, partial [Tanacetum coccineum]
MVIGGGNPNSNRNSNLVFLASILYNCGYLLKRRKDEKADEGFFVRYSINSKAFRVFNTRTKKAEENLHINFLENKPNVAGSRLDWLFDIDLLTNSMNYEPVTAGNKTNKNAGIKDNVDALPTQQYMLLPLLYDSPQSSKDTFADDAGKKTNEELANEGERNGYANKTNRDSTVSPSVNTARQNFTNADDFPTDPFIPNLEDTGIFSGAYDDEDVGAEADLNNLETTMNVSPIPTTRIQKDHLKDQIIGDINKVIQALTDPSWIEAMQEELLQFKLQKVWTLVDLPKGKKAIGTKWVYRNKKDEKGIVVRNKMDVKSAFLYNTIEEEVYVCQPPSFEDPQFPDKIYKKFDFVTVKITSTPIETNKALLKDEEVEDVDVHLYRSMIRSLMHLTASWPDIMFTVYACARFQVTPKVSHLHAVKRIFRYLKGQPKLGLWYPMDSPFDLESFSDSDYAEASLDRKSTTGDCQFLGKRYHFIRDSYEKKLIQVIKIHTDHNVADLLTKAFDVNETIYKEREDIMERAATSASSLEAEQDSGNIHRTQSIATLNESLPLRTDSGSGPRCQVTILGGAEAEIRLNLMLPVQVNVVEVSTLKFAETYNLVAFLEKPEESNGFEEIIDFLNASTVQYALTVNPTIYTTCIEQFWTSAKLDDAEGTDCLPTATIFVELERM